MAFFSRFSTAEFTFDGQTYRLEDLTRLVIHDPRFTFNNTYSQEWTIQDGTRPDQLAHAIYRDVNLWWTFFVVNRITASEWPLSSEELDEWLRANYSTIELDSPYRGEIDQEKAPMTVWHSTLVGGTSIFHGNNVVRDNQSDYSTAYSSGNFASRLVNPITLRQHFEMINDSRSRIRIVKPEFISAFISDFFEKYHSAV